MIKMLSLFSGLGVPEKALNNIGLDFDLVGYCEINKHSSKAYSLIHNVSETQNYNDITKINEKELPDFDLLFYGFPCQDLSKAGLQKGLANENGDKTRSGLIFDVFRIIKEKKPKYMVCENVEALTHKTFINEFKMILQELNDLGYNNYYDVLNARDYGIPQNRKRIFIISIRKDLKHDFVFPAKTPLKFKLKDILETNIDPKHYLSEHTIKVLTKENSFNRIAMFRRNLIDVETLNDNSYTSTFTTIIGHSSMSPYFLEKKYYEELDTFEIKNESDMDEFRIKSKQKFEKMIIRKPLPIEVYKLMGFEKEDFDKIRPHFSDNQLFKMAGNSICVTILECLFKQLFNLNQTKAIEQTRLFLL